MGSIAESYREMSSDKISTLMERESAFSIRSTTKEPLPAEAGPEPITHAHIQQIATELGLISLSWPPLPIPTVLDRVKWPSSYVTNSKKEKLALLYAENFRRQFVHLFPRRSPLVLAVDNECGLQVSLY